MSTQLTVGPHTDDAELERFKAIAGETFMVPPDLGRIYFQLAGEQNVRVVRLDGQVIGGLVLLPKGQYFGERKIPTAGIAAVAVAPESRAHGAATELLAQMLIEQRAAGIPLSTLYPATVALYRRAGYELAGANHRMTLPTKAIDVRDRTLPARPVATTDQPLIERVYNEWARLHPGHLDRREFHWFRIRELRGERAQGYVFGPENAIEGYIFIRSLKVEHRFHLHVHDMAAITPAAARRILTFLADHRTVRDEVTLWSGPTDAILMHLGEFPQQVHKHSPWMVRLVHVPRALEARGYPVGLSAELHFAVRDTVLPENDGRFVLHVADGTGHVTPGGRGSLELDVRGLAALYTGYLTPRDVALAHLATGPEESLNIAAALFAGPTPWMRDEF